jgi:hypothetical protein
MVFGYHSWGDWEYHFRLVVRQFSYEISGESLGNFARPTQSHGSGGRDEGGITISRRPNKRPSSEKAPGPSNASAAAVIIIPNANCLASYKPREGAGNHKRMIPRKHNPTRSAAYGVTNPATRAAPLVINTDPSSQFVEEELGGPER